MLHTTQIRKLLDARPSVGVFSVLGSTRLAVEYGHGLYGCDGGVVRGEFRREANTDETESFWECMQELLP